MGLARVPSIDARFTLMKLQSIHDSGRPWLTQRLGGLRLFGLLAATVLMSFAHQSSTSADAPRAGTVQEIIGGSERPADTPPWMVALIRTSDTEIPIRRRQFCGGVLLSDQWVLTAAHCVLRSTVANTRVIIGEGDIEASTAQQLALSQIVAHPNYNPKTFVNDVALLKLAEPTDLEPVTVLAEPLKLNLVGQSATVYGWGQTFVSPKRCDPEFDGVQEDADAFECRIHDFEAASRDFQARLLQTNLTLLSKAACNARVLELLKFLDVDVSDFDENTNFTPSDQFCAFDSSGEKGVCFGDSGGPITVEQDGGPALLGTASLIFGIGGCARDLATDVFTLVEPFEDFVEDVMHRDYALSFESFCPPAVVPEVEYEQAEGSGMLTRILWSSEASVNSYIVSYSAAEPGQNDIQSLRLDGSITELSAQLPSGAKFYVSVQAENDSCTGPVSQVLEVEVPVP